MRSNLRSISYTYYARHRSRGNNVRIRASCYPIFYVFHNTYYCTGKVDFNEKFYVMGYGIFSRSILIQIKVLSYHSCDGVNYLYS